MRSLLVLLLLTGCHAKFKKEAPTLGAVRTQIVTSGGPYVELGHMSNPTEGAGGAVEALGAIAALAVNINQEVQGAKLNERIAASVNPDEVNHSFNDGVSQTLQGGPPFAYTDDPNAPATLQIEVLSYGLMVPYIGAPGEFTYDLRVRIYKKDGDRVYKAHHTCAIGAGTPGAAEAVLGVVNNIKEIEEMTDDEIRSAFNTMAAYCGQTFVTKMRKHAG